MPATRTTKSILEYRVRNTTSSKPDNSNLICALTSPAGSLVDRIVGAARAPEGTRPGAALARTNCASASLPGVHYSRNTSQGPSQLILEQQLMTTHLEFKRARVDALRVHACGCVYQARQRLAKGPLKRFDTDKRYFGVSRQPCTRNTKVIINITVSLL